MAKKKNRNKDFDSWLESINSNTYIPQMAQNAPNNANYFADGGPAMNFEYYDDGTGMMRSRMAAPTTDYNIANSPLMDYRTQGFDGTLKMDTLSRKDFDYRNMTPEQQTQFRDYNSNVRQNNRQYRKDVRDTKIADLNAKTDNGEGFLGKMNSNSGVNMGGIVGAAAETARVWSDPNSTALDKVGNLLGIANVSKLYTADTEKGDANLNEMTGRLNDFKTNNIQDAWDTLGAGQALKLNKGPNQIKLMSNNLGWKDFKTKNMLGKTIGAMGQGAASGGSVGGAWGAAGGAVTGLLAGLGGMFTNNRRANKAYDAYMNKLNYLNNNARMLNAQAQNEWAASNANAIKNGVGQEKINDMANFRAYGGFLDNEQNINAMGGYFDTFNLSPNMINMQNQSLDNQKYKYNNQMQPLGFFSNSKTPNSFDFGGAMNGMDLPTGMQSYDAGGTHEENPNGGVQVGVDQQGNPNLVEEGEFRWGDYIFSDRIEVDPDILTNYTGESSSNGKKRGKKGKHQPTYADKAKKYAEKNKELANDPIGKNTINDYMDKLSKAEEEQKARDAAQQEYNNALANQTQGNPMYGSMKYSGMSNANAGLNEGNAAMGGMDNSGLSNVNRSGNEMLHAFGGNLYEGGGPILTMGKDGLYHYKGDDGRDYTLSPNEVEIVNGEPKPVQGTSLLGMRDANGNIITVNPQTGQMSNGTVIDPSTLDVNQPGYNYTAPTSKDFPFGSTFIETNPFSPDKPQTPPANNPPAQDTPPAVNVPPAKEGPNTNTGGGNSNTGNGVTPNPPNTGNGGGSGSGMQSNIDVTGNPGNLNGQYAAGNPWQSTPYQEWTRFGQMAKGLPWVASDAMGHTNWKYKIDNVPPDRMEALGRTGLALRNADHSGMFRAPDLMDVERQNNASQSFLANALRGISNVGGGNRGFVGAQSAAQNYNAQMGVGNNYAQTSAYNADQKLKADEFNKQTEQFNANANNQMEADNQKAKQFAKTYEMQGLQNANAERLHERNYKDAVDRAAAADRANNVTNMWDNALEFMAGEADRNHQFNMANSNPINQYYWDKNKRQYMFKNDPNNPMLRMNNILRRENMGALSANSQKLLNSYIQQYGNNVPQKLLDGLVEIERREQQRLADEKKATTNAGYRDLENEYDMLLADYARRMNTKAEDGTTPKFANYTQDEYQVFDDLRNKPKLDEAGNPIYDEDYYSRLRMRANMMRNMMYGANSYYNVSAYGGKICTRKKKQHYYMDV